MYKISLHVKFNSIPLLMEVISLKDSLTFPFFSFTECTGSISHSSVCVCVSVTPVRPPAVRRPLHDPALDPAASRATRSLHDNRNPLRPQPLGRRPRRRRRKEGREDGRERDEKLSLAPFACLIMKMPRTPESWRMKCFTH